MQKWLLIALLSSYSIVTSAQDKPIIASSKVFFANFETREITVEKIAKPTFSIGISQVEVIDNRFDTLHLGSINKDKKRDLWLIFANKQPLSKVISNSLLQNEPNPLSLLVVIKDFWFTESKDLNEFGQRKSLSEVNNNLVCKLEFYQKLPNNMVVAITRLDTTLTAPNDFATYQLMNKELIGNILQLSVDKIDKAIHAANFTKRKQIPLQDVYNSLKERFEKSILQDSVLRKGVYKTKEAFLNNAPSDTNYTVKQDKRKFIVLYLQDEKGNEYLSRESWGYCDGTTIFINNKGIFDPLYRIENAFYWSAFKKIKTESIPITTPFMPIGNGASVSVNTNANINYDSRILYLLNLDKGTHY